MRILNHKLTKSKQTKFYSKYNGVRRFPIGYMCTLYSSRVLKYRAYCRCTRPMKFSKSYFSVNKAYLIKNLATPVRSFLRQITTSIYGFMYKNRTKALIRVFDYNINTFFTNRSSLINDDYVSNRLCMICNPLIIHAMYIINSININLIIYQEYRLDRRLSR